MPVANQHFVPRLYLRRFSVNQNDLQIKVFVLRLTRFIEQASISGQAYRKFYYGKDGIVDSALQIQEGHFAHVLRAVDDGSIFRAKSGWIKDLLKFAIQMDFRNPKKNKSMLEIIEKRTVQFHQELDAGQMAVPAENQQEAHELINQIDKKVRENSIADLVATVDGILLKCTDLKSKVLENTTDVPFITSDNPSILYNQFFEEKSGKPNSGYGNCGFQIFLPINSRLAVMFYDSTIYHVGTRSQRNDNVIQVNNPEDVDELNILQIANCDSAIYGNERFSEGYALQLKEWLDEIRPPEEDETELASNATNLELSFVAFTDIAARMRFNFREGCVRAHIRKNPRLPNLFRSLKRR